MESPVVSQDTSISAENFVEDLERGVDQSLVFSTPYFGKDIEIVRSSEWGKDSPTLSQLESMRQLDGHARALYRLLTLPVQAALKTADFVVDKGEDGEEELEFIKSVFLLPAESGGMTKTFFKLMAQILGAVFTGFAAFEKVYWVPSDGPLKGKITLKKLAHRPSSTVTFVADETGEFRGIRQRATFGGKMVDVFIPRDYIFYYAVGEDERKFYGVSFFESAFSHYDKKIRLYYTAHLAAQRSAVGTRVGKIPRNASVSEKRAFKASLANLSLAQHMTFPEGFDVSLLKEGGSFDFLSLINHHNHMMSESVLANFFDSNTGAGANDGSFVNFARPGDEMFQLMLRALMEDIASAINHFLIVPLIDLNFSSKVYPKFVWGTFSDEQREAITSTFSKLLSNPANVTPEFVRALEQEVAKDYGLSIDYDEVAEREAQEKEAKAPPTESTESPAPIPEAENAPESPEEITSDQLDWDSLHAFENSITQNSAASGEVQLSEPLPKSTTEAERKRALELFEAALGEET